MWIEKINKHPDTQTSVAPVVSFPSMRGDSGMWSDSFLCCFNEWNVGITQLLGTGPPGVLLGTLSRPAAPEKKTKKLLFLPHILSTLETQSLTSRKHFSCMGKKKRSCQNFHRPAFGSKSGLKRSTFQATEKWPRHASKMTDSLQQVRPKF